ncbi:MAG: tripartite tricarboxylate transporter substrate binding protein [Comamonas sp.]
MPFTFRAAAPLQQLAAAALGLGLIASAAAQTAAPYPSKPISLIVPYGAGGGTDALARALTERMGKKLGQPFIVESKPGAAGTLGVTQMVRTKPDGYSLTLVPLSVFRQPYLAKVQYDPLKDLSYIATVMNYTYAIAVPYNAPWKNIQELVADAKQQPDKYSYAGSAQYSSNHLAMTELARAAQLQWTFVPYKGDAEAINALLGGHVDIISATSTILPFIASKKARVLAVAGAERSPDFPGIPTLKEAGYPVEMASPLGIAGPAGLPKDIVDKLDSTVREVMQDPDFIQQARTLGIELNYRDSKAYTAWASTTYAKEKTIIARLAGQ